MAYTTIDDPTAYFQTITWTGNGSDPRTITFDGNSDMQPDWVWEKSRSLAYQHNLYDSVRGGGKGLDLPAAAVEVSNNANGYISAFTSDGFTLTAGSTNNELLNENTTTYVGWGWKAGTSFTNDASGTGIGSIDSAGSFNNDSGFSIVSYTGTGSNGTLKHGLNSTPSTIIVKERGGDGNWIVYHSAVGNGKYLSLTDTGAARAASNYWNSTSPTSSVFTVGATGNVNGSSKTYIAYCFADVKGYSKVSGSYTGNGNADGTFVYTGQKSAFIMIKAASRTGTWNMYDTKRNTFNNIKDFQVANVAEADVTGNTYQNIDILSNGFKCYGTGSGTNESGSTYIYMAFAENPFVTSTGVPATAR